MIPAINKTEDLINSGEILYLPCNKLKDHPLHFEFYTQSHLEGLVCSIREAGLLEPIVVCPLDDDNYRILSGHYRIRAVRRLKWKKVLCRVVKCDSRLSCVIYCTSNLLTRGLSAMEEAYMISRLVSQEKFTLAEIGKMWGKSKSWVSRRLGLLTHLDAKLKKEMGMGYLSPRIAQELMRLPQGNDQERVLRIIRKGYMNKDETAQLVTWWLNANETERRVVEENGFSPVNIGDSNKVKTVAANLSKCAGILEQLIHIVKRQRVIEWWPMDEYSSFRDVSEQLDKLLTEQLVGG